MKKKTIKKLKQLAAQLPPAVGRASIGVPVMGYELIKERDIHEVAGKPVDPDTKYRQIEQRAVPVNHLNKLKSALKRGGAAQAQDYARGVIIKDEVQKTIERAKEQSKP